MPTRVSMINKIEINAPQDKVFDYISNVGNDPKWRTEVDRMDVQGPIEVGTLVVEYSTLFGPFVKTVTPTFITELNHPNDVSFETSDGVKPWLLSHRSVRAISSDRAVFTYKLESDLPLSGTPGKIFRALMLKLYGPRLPKYLITLKDILESDNLPKE